MASPTQDHPEPVSGQQVRNDFSQQYELRLEAIAKANELNKAIVFDALTAAGITRITVEFDGEGDSGQINGVTAYAGEAPTKLLSTSLTLHVATQNADNPTITETSLPSAIEDLCYDYLSQCHGGWQDNDGAYGTFEFDVSKRSIHLDFNERFTDTTNSSHDF
jgi:hypothetical protein